ncbi:NAD(P)H nitroreductase [Thalassotalea sp. PLHSN55]|uniref:NAD(P)H nitroreductase n=1 Tax=Thalassotalea sp. PLHSN55 TaxID=3435888 RepID=UPI003F86C208
MQAVDLLINRQSTPMLQAPAPSNDHLALILQAGMKVPDHGGIKPWHFTVAQERGLHKLSKIFVEAVTLNNADEAKIAKTAKMAFRAPLIVTVTTKIVEHEKVPKQEQVIAAGCAVHAMQMAAVALGYGAMWRTGELSYNSHVKQQLNVSEDDEIVGFLYIGTVGKECPTKPKKSYTEHTSFLS